MVWVFFAASSPAIFPESAPDEGRCRLSQDFTLHHTLGPAANGWENGDGWYTLED